MTSAGYPDGDLPAAVFRHWIHAREEDGGDLEVYRPEGLDFPPSFGRDGFEMRPDGEFIQDDIGPADELVQVVGRWTAVGPRRLAVSFPGAHREAFSFEIVAVDDSVLRRRPQSIGGERYKDLSGIDEAAHSAFAALPPATGFRLLDFDAAQIITQRSFPPQFVLRVSGTKPFANMDVELAPFVYVRQPEYWEIEVVGSLRGFGLPVTAPYTVSLPLAGFTGSLGIDVIGATRRERFDVPPRSGPQG